MTDAASSADTQARWSVGFEDQARADFYALLSRLYAAAPDAALLRAIAGADDLPVTGSEDAARQLARSWSDLVRASRAMDPEAAAQEYQDLFVGVGKSEVSLHASAYLGRAGSSVLAELRGQLARLGLARQPDITVYEDHLAAVCETMRVLIGGAPGIAPASSEQQRDFFLAYVSSWAGKCCDAIRQSPIANYYRRVAEFTEHLMMVEHDAFAIE